jgi:hypothetical protein
MNDEDLRAHRDALYAAYESLLHEYVGLLLSMMGDDEIDDRRAVELRFLLPEAALEDFDQVLAFQRAERQHLVPDEWSSAA